MAPRTLMPTTLAMAIAAAIVWNPAQVAAHHAFSAIYLVGRHVTIEGTIVEMVYRKPHSYVHLLVVDSHHQAHRWAMEWRARDDGRGQGGPMQTLMVGDHVIATGSPGRDPGVFRILVETIVRTEDGWQWRGVAN